MQLQMEGIDIQMIGGQLLRKIDSEMRVIIGIVVPMVTCQDEIGIMAQMGIAVIQGMHNFIILYNSYTDQ